MSVCAEGEVVHDVMERLLELAAIDDDLAEMRVDSSHLPLKAEELEAKKATLAEAVVAKETELEEVGKKRRHEERELEDLESKRDGLKGRQLEIKTNEEYAALIQEIKYAERLIGETEDRILELDEQGEKLEAAVVEAREAMAQSVGGLDEELAGIREEIRKVDERLEVRLDERRRVAMHIDPALLQRYERILESKGDSALAPIEGETCSGCYMKLPPQMVIEVRKGRRIMECESCGRILCCIPDGRLEDGDGTA